MAEYAKHYRVYFIIECEVYTIIIVIIILIIHFGCIFNKNNDVAIKIFPFSEAGNCSGSEMNILENFFTNQKWVKFIIDSQNCKII